VAAQTGRRSPARHQAASSAPYSRGFGTAKFTLNAIESEGRHETIIIE